MGCGSSHHGIVIVNPLIPSKGMHDHSNIVASPFRDKLPQATDAWTFVETQILQYGDKIGLIDDATNVKYSFAALVDTVNNIAAHFQQSGMGPGDAVAYLANNSANAFICLLAVIATGAVAVPITMVYSESIDDFLNLTEMIGCSFAVCGKNFIRQTLAFKKYHAETCKELYLVNGYDPNFVCIDEILNRRPEIPFEKPKIRPKVDVALIVFTSGTTNLPKSILHSHYSIIAQSWMVGLNFLALSKKEYVFLGWNHMIHVSGIATNIGVLVSGATLVIVNGVGITSSKFADILEKHNITALLAFPTALGNLLKSVPSGKKFSNVKTIVMSGGPTTKSVSNLIRETFTNLQTLFLAYGMSESMGLITAGLPNYIDADSCGFPHPHCFLKIVSESGEILGRNTLGEMWFLSPANMLGYLNNDEANAETFDSHGFIRSGDMGYIDENGRFFCSDRIKSMIKCMDYQVSPMEIENILSQHLAVSEVAVVGKPMEEFGEAPTACVVLRENFDRSNAIKEELKQMIQEGSHKSKHLYGGVYFIDKIPMTPVQKVDRKRLLIMLEESLLE